jgi:SAM-dependent MidA family methyltransferase
MFVDKYQFSTQGQFLTSLGIKERLEQLKKPNDSSLEASVNRLIGEKEMGSIYKVLQFSRIYCK